MQEFLCIQHSFHPSDTSVAASVTLFFGSETQLQAQSADVLYTDVDRNSEVL